MSTSETTRRPFAFIGGQMCLDFANTLDGLRGGVTREYLCGYNDLVAWSQQAGSITEDHATDLLHKAESHPAEAVAVLEGARMLREAVYRIFAAVATDIQPMETDLTILNAELGKAIAGGASFQSRMVSGGSGPVTRVRSTRCLGPSCDRLPNSSPPRNEAWCANARVPLAVGSLLTVQKIIDVAGVRRQVVGMSRKSADIASNCAGMKRPNPLESEKKLERRGQTKEQKNRNMTMIFSPHSVLDTAYFHFLQSSLSSVTI
nr:ABATE domain-containing protein [Ktedonobacter sp. SOSP1-52]